MLSFKDDFFSQQQQTDRSIFNRIFSGLPFHHFVDFQKDKLLPEKNVFFGADDDNDDADAGTHLKVFFSSAEIFCGRTRARE